MASIFDAFQKTVSGDKPNGPDSTALEGAVRYGELYNQLRVDGGHSAANSPQIARKLINGRHAFSENVLNGYADQGIEPPEKVKMLLGELDNIAVASQSIAGMNNRTRAQYLARGYTSLDPNRILESESKIMKQVGDLSRGVLHHSQLVKNLRGEEALRSDRLTNTGREITNEINQRKLRSADMTLEAQGRQQKYHDILKDYSVKDLLEADKAGGVKGVPREYLSSYLFDRLTTDINNRYLSSLREPKKEGVYTLGGAPAVGASSVRGGAVKGLLSGAKKSAKGQKVLSYTGQEKEVIAQLRNYDPSLLGTVIQKNIEEMNSDADPNLAMRGTSNNINVPNIGWVPLTLAVQAMSDIKLRQDKLTKSEAQTFESMKVDLAKDYALTQHEFGARASVMGLDVTGNEEIQTTRGVKVDRWRNAMAGGDVLGANEALKDLKNYDNSVFDAVIETAPKEQKAFLTELRQFKGITSGRGAVDYLVSAAGDQLAHSSETSLVWREVAAFTNRRLQMAKEALDGDGEITARDLLRTGRGKSADDRVRKLSGALNDNDMAKIYVGELSEQAYSYGIAETLGALREQITKQLQGAQDTNDDVGVQKYVGQIKVIERLLTGAFGKHFERQTFTNEKVPFVKEIPILYTDENGDRLPLLDKAGNQMTQSVVDTALVATYMDNAQKLMDDAGIKIQLVNEWINTLRRDKGKIANVYKANNPEQLSMLAKFAVPVRHGTSPQQYAESVVDRAIARIQTEINSINRNPLSAADTIDALPTSGETKNKAIKQIADELQASDPKKYKSRTVAIDAAFNVYQQKLLSNTKDRDALVNGALGLPTDPTGTRNEDK